MPVSGAPTGEGGEPFDGCPVTPTRYSAPLWKCVHDLPGGGASRERH
jgi:hypothetical protein